MIGYNGEADWFDPFNDHLFKSEHTHGTPWNMAFDARVQIHHEGGIGDQSGIKSVVRQPHSGAYQDFPGRRCPPLRALRAQPFVNVHPKSGSYGKDQQGNYIPSSRFT